MLRWLGNSKPSQILDYFFPVQNHITFFIKEPLSVTNL